MIRSVIISAFAALPVMALPGHADEFLSLAIDVGAGVHGFGLADTPSGAQSNAMTVCSKLASKCEIVITRSGTCTSLAYDYSSGGYGVFNAQTAEEAAQAAIPHCTSYGNPECQTVETVCAK